MGRVFASMVAASAPGRICLVGESLDWMIRGESVVATVPLRTTVTVGTSRHGGPVTLRSGHPLRLTRPLPTSALGTYAGDPLDLLQATVKVTAPECRPMLPGALVESSSTVPIGAGVSSSAAVTVAAVAALLALGQGTLPDRREVSRRAFTAETEELRSGAGWMDFLSVSYGGVCVIRPGEYRQGPTVTRFADELGVPVVLVDTCQRRATSRALTDKRNRYACGESDIMLYAKSAPLLVTELLSALTEPRIDYGHVGSIAHRLRPCGFDHQRGARAVAGPGALLDTVDRGMRVPVPTGRRVRGEADRLRPRRVHVRARPVGGVGGGPVGPGAASGPGDGVHYR